MSWYFKLGGSTTPTIPGEALGVRNFKGSFKKFSGEKFTFRLDAENVDADPIFPFESEVIVYDPTGLQVFVGTVSKTRVAGSSAEENQYYELTGPWYWFEDLANQQEWQSWNGVTNVLVSTLQTATTINSDVNGTLLDFGAVINGILDFLLSAPNPDGFTSPIFQKGKINIATMIPFTQVDRQTCAQAIISVLQWVPDAVGWFDHSAYPPRFNVDLRGNLKAISLPAFNADGTAIELVPRNDLLVKAIIVKYKIITKYNGKSLVSQVLDVYPPKSPDPAFKTPVIDLDLVGGSTNLQAQNLVVSNRPTDYNAAAGTGALKLITLPWLKREHRADWMKSYTIPAGTDPDQVAYGAPGNNTLNDITVQVNENDFTVLSVVTTLVDNGSGVTLKLPSGNVPPGKGPGTGKGGGNALDYLSQELIDGSVTDWMTSDQKVYEALVRVEVVVKYNGSDPVIQNLMGLGPFYVKKISSTVKVTNGSTQVYTQVTSNSAGEIIPKGLAQALYNGLSVLHYEGSFQLEEVECTQQVKLNNVLNLTGGRAAWQTMNAQVDEIEMDIDNGTTVVHLGPPMELTGQQRLDILRADRGRVQASTLTERSTGEPGSDNPISGTGAVAAIAMNLPPSMQPADPWRCQWRHGAGGIEIQVNPISTLYKQQGTPGNVVITGLGAWFACTPNADAVWIEGAVAAQSCTGGTIRSIGQGNGDFDTTGATPSWDASGKGDLVDDGATPPNQTKFRRLIATITADANGNPVFKYFLNSQLILKNKFVSSSANAEPCIYPEPFGS